MELSIEENKNEHKLWEKKHKQMTRDDKKEFEMLIAEYTKIKSKSLNTLVKAS